MEHDTSIIAPRTDTETEWWYYHGHLQTEAGDLGFHLAFFRQKTDNITIGRFIKGRHFYDHAWFAHLSICEIDTGTFHYAERRSNGGNSDDFSKVWVEDWSIAEKNDAHVLKAHGREYGLELTLSLDKPISENHGHKSFEKTPGEVTDYCSITRMEVSGKVTVQGRELHVKGAAWMDRECGSFQLNHHLQGWDWFAIQADDGHELMVYRMKDADGKTTAPSMTLIHSPDESPTIGNMDGWQLTPTRHWTSEHTGIRYPVDWHLKHSSLGVDLQIRASVDCSEIDARGSSCMIYWEGPAIAEGELFGKQVRANTYMELMGYNDTVNIGKYDYSKNNLPLFDWLYCSARYFLRRNGVTNKMPKSD